MKKSIQIAIMLPIFAVGSISFAQAGIAEGQQRIGLNLGVGIPTTVNDFNDSAKVGFGGGVTYLYQLSDRLGMGGQVNVLSFPGETRQIRSTSGGLLEAESDSQIIQAELIGRLNYRQDKKVSPFVQIGIGVNQFSQETDGKPVTGSTWSDTSTAETRTVADESSVGVSLSYGGGFESVVKERFLLGVEAYWNTFLIDDDEFGSSAVNLPSVFAKIGFIF